MNIDQTDLKIIRRIESKGLSRFTVLARELNLPAEEIKIRIKQLEASRFIKGYGLSLFFPPLAGGDWYWVLAQMETQRPIKYLIHHLKQHLPYITEISFHRYLSRGACPNVTALFYTRNLRRDLMLIKKIEG
ncbi:MAG: Lrp/AsnC family transcriptional regulator, partial [candidate division WOR-3 bacterium]